MEYSEGEDPGCEGISKVVNEVISEAIKGRRYYGQAAVRSLPEQQSGDRGAEAASGRLGIR